jgi:hypothetical protein
VLQQYVSVGAFSAQRLLLYISRVGHTIAAAHHCALRSERRLHTVAAVKGACLPVTHGGCCPVAQVLFRTQDCRCAATRLFWLAGLRGRACLYTPFRPILNSSLLLLSLLLPGCPGWCV